jgi:hypothetical protein
MTNIITAGEYVVKLTDTQIQMVERSLKNYRVCISRSSKAAEASLGVRRDMKLQVNGGHDKNRYAQNGFRGPGIKRR